MTLKWRDRRIRELLSLSLGLGHHDLTFGIAGMDETEAIEMNVHGTPLHDRILVRRLEEKKPYSDPPMEVLGNRKVLLTRMDNAFSDYSHEAEKLSVLLAEPRDPFSWTSYHDLLNQRTAEVVAYEKYRSIKDELFALINPPAVPDRPESSVNYPR